MSLVEDLKQLPEIIQWLPRLLHAVWRTTAIQIRDYRWPYVQARKLRSRPGSAPFPNVQFLSPRVCLLVCAIIPVTLLTVASLRVFPRATRIITPRSISPQSVTKWKTLAPTTSSALAIEKVENRWASYGRKTIAYMLRVWDSIDALSRKFSAWDILLTATIIVSTRVYFLSLYYCSRLKGAASIATVMEDMICYSIGFLSVMSTISGAINLVMMHILIRQMPNGALWILSICNNLLMLSIALWSYRQILLAYLFAFRRENRLGTCAGFWLFFKGDAVVGTILMLAIFVIALLYLA